MNILEWVIGFIAVFDIVGMVCMFVYLWRRRSEIFQIHYTFVISCMVFLIGASITRFTEFVLIWPQRFAGLRELTTSFPVGADWWVDAGIVFTSIGAILIVRFIGRLAWNTEWLWLATAAAGVALPPLIGWLIP